MRTLIIILVILLCVFATISICLGYALMLAEDERKRWYSAVEPIEFEEVFDGEVVDK